MSKLSPLFADERRAAELFCMTPKEFRGLVNDGHLPPARDLGGFERWDVEELRKIARGEAMEGGAMSW